MLILEPGLLLREVVELSEKNAKNSGFSLLRARGRIERKRVAKQMRAISRYGGEKIRYKQVFS